MAIRPGHHPSTPEWADDALRLLRAEENNPELSDTNSTGVKIVQGRTTGTLAGNRAPDTGPNLVFRKFKPGVHNGPKKEDFTTLANTYYEAAVAELRKTLANEPEKLEKLLKILENRHNMFLKRLENPTGIAIDADMEELRQKKPEKYKAILERHGDFAPRIIQTGDLLKELNANFMAVLLHAEGQEITTNNLDKKMKEVRVNVKKQIEERGRANSIHLYEVLDHTNPTIKSNRISTAVTIGNTTVPSHIRDGSNKEMAVSNFVRRSYGSVSSEDKASIGFTGLTHSSYPPINLFGKNRISGVSIENEIKIRAIAIKGVEQVLLELAKQEMQTKGKTSPIKIQLTSLSLITAAIKLRQRAARPGETESKQLEEIIIALGMCQARSPLELMLDSQKIRIEVDITQMNMPTNIGKSALEGIVLPSYGDASKPEDWGDASQKYSRARGFVDYCNNFSNYLGVQQSQNNQLSAILSSSSSNNQEENEKRKEIQNEYKTLYDHQSFLQGDSSKNNEKLYKKKLNLYKDCLKKIQKLEGEHKDICIKLIERNKGNFDANKKTSFAQELETLENKSPRDANMKDYVDNCRLMFDTQKIYHEGLYRNPENAYEFQARYLLLNYRMGRHVEWFCKSAEDRTGRLGEKIEELLTFHELYGRFPRMGDQNDNDLIKQISISVHLGSVNRQVTDDNDPGALGIQVEDEFGAEHLYMSKTDKKMGNLAKDVCTLHRPENTIQKKLDLGAAVPPSPEVLNELSPTEKPKNWLAARFSGVEKNYGAGALSASDTTHSQAMQFSNKKRTRENTETFEHVFNENFTVDDAGQVLDDCDDDTLELSSDSIQDIENILTAAENSDKSIVLDDQTKQFLDDKQKEGVNIPEIIKTHLEGQEQAEREADNKLKR
jgi:hypothetical protein